MQQAGFIFADTGLFVVVVALLIFITFLQIRRLGALHNALSKVFPGIIADQTREILTSGFERLQDGVRSQADQLARTHGALSSAIGDLSIFVTQKLGESETAAQAGRALALSETLGVVARLTETQTNLADRISRDLAGVSASLREEQERLRNQIDDRLDAIRASSEAKLDQMRTAVDEKLQSALEQRIGESFQRVAEQFAQVQQAIGQVQSVATQVGDLKRLFSNVKTRGGWGETQARQILDDTLPPGTVELNFRADPSSTESVEFAVRMPARDGDQPIYLPIDAKFPTEDYDRVLLAAETADRDGEVAAVKALAARITSEAKKIAEKYVRPPRTTDIAVLYLPSEGLFAEVARVPGLIEQAQRQHRVLIMSPSLLPALLHTIRVGHFTLQLEHKAGEISKILSAVKSEWAKLGEAMDTVAKRADMLTKGIDSTQTRIRAVGRTLKNIDVIDAETSNALLSLDDSQKNEAPEI